MCTCVCTNVPVCTCTCTYRCGVCVIYWAQVVVCRCAHACAYAWIDTDSRNVGLHPSDLTQPWTLLRLRSIRIIYPTPSLSSRLMHGGVKHLVMLNHSGAQHARSHPEWQHRAGEGAGRGKKYHIALRERKRGRWRREKGEGLEGFGRGKGVVRGTSGVYLVWVNIDKMQINLRMFCQCVFRCAPSKETGHKWYTSFIVVGNLSMTAAVLSLQDDEVELTET